MDFDKILETLVRMIRLGLLLLGAGVVIAPWSKEIAIWCFAIGLALILLAVLIFLLGDFFFARED